MNNKPLKSTFVMTTFTLTGQVYKKDQTYKTKAGMRRSKEKQNLQYGAHLRAEAFEVFEDGSSRPTFCVA